MSLDLVFLGAGNLATQLSLALKKSGFNILQVYSRRETSVKLLAAKLEAGYTTSTSEITTDADVYFVALKDSAFDEVLPDISFSNKLLVHCSGSLPLSVLEKFAENCGVLYPLQTFSIDRDVSFEEISVFIEANSKRNENILRQIAESISGSVSVLNSGKRIYLHIAAVYACNFVNYFYTVASDILQSKDLSFDVLKPLIMETALKVKEMEPESAQTGPAVRFDGNIISSHLMALSDFPKYMELYGIISESIFERHNRKDNLLLTEEFKKVKAFVFDVDGVLSKDSSALNENGDPVRTGNVKDGFAIRNVIRLGYPVAVITGGYLDRVRERCKKIGVEYYYDSISDKVECLLDFLKKTGIGVENVLFMGDDLVDFKAMKKVGVPVCPKDAVTEIKAISKYVSPKNGGEGCARDVIEKTLRIQGKWFSQNMFFNNEFSIKSKNFFD